MKQMPRLLSGTALLALLVAGCATPQSPMPIEMPQPPSIVSEAERAEPQVQSTIVPGDMPVPRAPEAAEVRRPRPGTISLTLPGADVRTAAASVQEVTGIPIELDAGVTGQVTLVTPGTIARSEVIGLF